MTSRNLTVTELIEALSKFPPDATVEPYEGEVIGVRIDDADGTIEIGFVETYLRTYG